MQDDVDRAYTDVVAEVSQFLETSVERAVEAGVRRDGIVVDPGIGFGKNLAHNLALLGSLDRLGPPDRPVLVGTSRKSFLGVLTGRAVTDRLAGTVASVTAAVLKGADIVRVHDVASAVDACRVAEALR